MDYLEKYALWLKSVPEEDPLHRELEEMQGDDALIRERFMKDIAFGTAGLRGILGAGTSCMNRYTVGRAAQGIANLICEEGPEAMEKGVVIAHDPRHGSKEFSGLAAEILAGAFETFIDQTCDRSHSAFHKLYDLPHGIILGLLA